MSLLAHATAVAAESPPLGDWPAVGHLIGPGLGRPGKYAAKDAGWPVRRVTVLMPASTQAGRGSGRMVPTPVLVVPGPWLRRLAELAGVPWKEACGGTTPAQE